MSVKSRKNFLKKKRFKRFQRHTRKYKYVIFVDGSASGKHRLATAAAIVFHKNEIIERVAIAVKTATSNQSEYLALILGLYIANKLGLDGKCVFYSDSRLVVNQISGVYKVKSKWLKELHSIAIKLLRSNYDIRWIAREHNKVADGLAHNALTHNGDTNYMLDDDEFYNMLPEWLHAK